MFNDERLKSSSGGVNTGNMLPKSIYELSNSSDDKEVEKKGEPI